MIKTFLCNFIFHFFANEVEPFSWECTICSKTIWSWTIIIWKNIPNQICSRSIIWMHTAPGACLFYIYKVWELTYFGFNSASIKLTKISFTDRPNISKTPHVLTVLWLDSNDVVTILSSTRNQWKATKLCICATLIPTQWLCVMGI